MLITKGPAPLVIVDGVDIRSTQDGKAGADKVGATPIVGLTGETVQALLEALAQATETVSLRLLVAEDETMIIDDDFNVLVGE